MKSKWICILAGVIVAASPAMDLKKEADLNGAWRFEVGDRAEYAGEEFNDSRWDRIQAPGRWEDQGFPGYDGFAWYRRSFTLSQGTEAKKLFLQLGQIDDVDRVYINGHPLNGSGRMPPDFTTAYNENRLYFLPAEYLHFGAANVVAVRVYDEMESGGIVNGDLGVYSERDYPNMMADLTGYWRFRTGDDLLWRHDDFDDRDWERIIVPIQWELQGHEEHDGYAWYRRSVRVDGKYRGGALILMLGKIDDVDEVYFNGKRIGGTGRFPYKGEDLSINDWWYRERVYTIPGELVRWDGENTIAVRTFDAWLDGGIYEGPVGLMTRREYMRYNKGLMDHLFEMIDSWFK